MPPTAIELTEKDVEQYRAAAIARYEQEHKKLEQLREKAWRMAIKAAKLLKEKYGTTRVAVFGSLIHEGCFTPWSDIDIAAWGIPAEKTLKAMGEVMDMGHKIKISLVDMSVCKPSLKKVIEKEGVTL